VPDGDSPTIDQICKAVQEDTPKLRTVAQVDTPSGLFHDIEIVGAIACEVGALLCVGFWQNECEFVR
jgi:aspartate aminotransferase-like enzyme